MGIISWNDGMTAVSGVGWQSPNCFLNIPVDRKEALFTVVCVLKNLRGRTSTRWKYGVLGFRPKNGLSSQFLLSIMALSILRYGDGR
jgi:hypothetical protein